jgi:two-component system sensor histidine kinase PilS (NtrC family)
VASTDTALGPRPNGRYELAAADDGWGGLKTLIWARLLVVSLALPFGILLRFDATVGAWRVVGVALATVAGLSAFYWLGTVWRRGREIQICVQLAFDVVLVTGLSAMTGGQQSPFSLFYVLVAITGGLQSGFVGGLITAVAASTSYHLLNPAGYGLVNPGVPGAPKPAMFSALLLVLAVLSATLQQRAARARERLERASRELDRVRFDNDVILRHLTSGVITLDATGMVAYLNPAAEDVLGLRQAGLRGRWFQDALPERLHPLRDALLKVLESHSPQSRGELMLTSAANKPLPLGISTNLLTHEGRVTGVVAVFQDLTEVREMEQRALRNQTLAQVGALAAGIAHELRNGLSPISGSVEVLQRELKLQGENAQLMGLITTECNRLNRFVTDLLAYARERAVVKMPMDLGEVLAELCETIARDPRCGSGVMVKYEPGDELVEVPCDREQLRQVWLNLAGNALDAMEGSGTLTVRWRPQEPGQVVIEFVDTGPGIARENLPRVGQPFFTTKKGGSGLGLPIAQRIVERHSGTLMLLSAGERGTIARITLPATAGAAARAA